MTVQVDIIILSWNRSRETCEAIESAVKQTGVEKRILIVDQGSEPEALEALRKTVVAHPEASLRELGRNVGVAAGRNIASAMGSAPYIVALDNDAVFADDRVLERLVRKFERQPQLGAIGFRIVNFFTGEDDPMCWDYPGTPLTMADREFMTTRFIGAGHAIRREGFDAVDGYDAALFFAGEERDLSYRILNRGYRIHYCPEFAVLHKVDPAARVNWRSGRYFYTVRNALYSNYKFGEPVTSLLRSAMALLLKGVNNGVPGQALRGIVASVGLSWRFAREAENKWAYKLNDDVKSYIAACERRASESFMSRLRRQFERLPGQA